MYLNVFGVRICTYFCQYLHVLHVYVRIKFTRKCKSHWYVHMRAIRAYTNKIRTKIRSYTCKYVPNTCIFLRIQKVRIHFLMFILQVFVRICTYISWDWKNYVHIRTRLVYVRICMYMRVYVRILRKRYLLCMYMIVSVCIVSICTYCMYMHVSVCIVCICTYVRIC